MKLALVFVFGFVVFISTTQQQRFPHHYPSRQGISPYWPLNDYFDRYGDNLYSYLMARRFSYPVNNLPQYKPYHANVPSIQSSQTTNFEDDQYDDVQSRSKFLGGRQPSNAEEQANPRLFFNYVTTAGSNTYFNPLLKTIYYVTSSTATTTIISTCITSTAFSNNLYTSTCRRRREVLEILKEIQQLQEKEDEQNMKRGEHINPTAVNRLPIMKTADPTNDPDQFRLSSSKDENHSPGKLGSIQNEAVRSKRFFTGLFYSTTTITSYTFVTSLTTKTLASNFAATTALSCRPSAFAYC